MPYVIVGKNPNAVIGDLHYDQDTYVLSLYTEHGWAPVGGNMKMCIVCKQYIHKALSDHPFCNNNLEYLEWKSMQ